jgi:hypothetical protein
MWDVVFGILCVFALVFVAISLRGRFLASRSEANKRLAGEKDSVVPSARK